MPNSDDEGDSCVLLGTALIDLMPGLKFFHAIIFFYSFLNISLHFIDQQKQRGCKIFC